MTLIKLKYQVNGKYDTYFFWPYQFKHIHKTVFNTFDKLISIEVVSHNEVVRTIPIPDNPITLEKVIRKEIKKTMPIEYFFYWVKSRKLFQDIRKRQKKVRITVDYDDDHFYTYTYSLFDYRIYNKIVDNQLDLESVEILNADGKLIKELSIGQHDDYKSLKELEQELNSVKKQIEDFCKKDDFVAYLIQKYLH